MSHGRFRRIVWGGGAALLVVAAGAVAWRLLTPRAAAPQPPSAAPAARTLPEEDRKYIWDVEHQGLVLKKYGFSALKSALRQGNRAALLSLLSPDFAGEAPARPREVRRAGPPVEAIRYEEVASEPRQALNRDEFIERLLQYRGRFAAPPDVDLALMTLSPEAPGDVAGMWKGEVQLRMWGGVAPPGAVPAEAVRGASAVGLAAAGAAALPAPPAPGEVMLNLVFRIAAPTEDELSAGGWLRGCFIRQAVTEEASHYLFKDVTAARGIDAGLFFDNWTRGSAPLKTMTGGAYLADFDRDGCLDLLIVDVNRTALYKGLPDGRFADVTAAVGLPAKPDRGLAAAFIDLDGDGWEDLILGGYVFHNVADGKGGRRFEDVSFLCNWRVPPDAVGIAVCDYDRDGRMDFYVTRPGELKASSWVDGTGAGPGNQLWHNAGKGFLMEDVTQASGTAGGHRSTFTAAWLDADNDGWPDLYVINEFGAGVLLLNNHDGTFRENPLTDGPGDFGSMGLTCGDIDNDGNIDLYVASMYSKAGSRILGNVPADAYPPDLMAQMRRFVTGSQLWLNTGKGRFEPKARDYRVAAVGWSYGAALLDLDNDGWLDLYATCGFISEDRTEPDG